MRIVPVDGEDEYDAETLADLHRLTFDDGSPLPDFHVGWWWLLMHQETAIGFAGLRSSYRWPGNSGYLWRAGVAPGHRGRGLQKRLIRVRERKARALGWEWLFTDTTQSPASSNSLIACGFKVYQPSHGYGYDQTIYWRKRLR
jgi:GNAT superfamily N-acetyltransferase